MGKECRTCVFNTKNERLQKLTERIKNCWAWADEEEYQRREDEISTFKDLRRRIITRPELKAGMKKLESWVNSHVYDSNCYRRK